MLAGCSLILASPYRDGFLRHRHARMNLSNIQAIVGQVVACTQLLALTMRVLPDPRDHPRNPPIEADSGSGFEPAPLSSYDLGIIEVKRVFAWSLLHFDIHEEHLLDLDRWKISYWSSIGVNNHPRFPCLVLFSPGGFISADSRKPWDFQVVVVFWLLFGGIMLRIVMHASQKGEAGASSHHIQMRCMLYRQLNILAKTPYKVRVLPS